MNPSMYLVAVLAFCALPSAVGLMCYKCAANVITGGLCTNMNTYSNVTCTGANAECARTTIVSLVTAYVLDCVNEAADCSTYNAFLCSNVIQGAAAFNVTVSSCTTTCCKDKDKCNMVPKEPPTNATATPTATGTDSGAKAPTTFINLTTGLFS